MISPTNVFTYKDSGVDVAAGDALVESIKESVKSTYNDRVFQGVGGFASLYKMGEDRFLASGTDGVGTKLKVAQYLDRHDTIGIDLVAMCVNDIICTGARPLFFQDYLATGKLNPKVASSLIKGIITGCEISDMALIGGETAEMPGVYEQGVYDLAGFAVGEVEKAHLVDGTKIATGDTLVGLYASGFHSNGYSLLRKIVPHNDPDYESLLIPTKIYASIITNILKTSPGLIKGMAHITGGGFSNIKRMNEGFGYNIVDVPDLEDIGLAFMKRITVNSRLAMHELFNTFNMGIGFCIATDRPDELREKLNLIGERSMILGKVEVGSGVSFSL